MDMENSHIITRYTISKYNMIHTVNYNALQRCAESDFNVRAL